jgi:GDP-L-fucose synthase
MKQFHNKIITGGTGLVGSAFSNEYLKVGSKHNDLRDPMMANHLISWNEPETVIHCAAKVGGIGSNINNNAGFFRDNILINTNILEACRKFKVKNFIGFLSTCIFPDKTDYPLTPEMIHLGPPHYSNYGYAYAKRMLEVQIRSYSEQYGLNYKSVIPCNIYGPNDNFSLEHGHVIPMLIHKCYLAQKYNVDFEIWGTGKPLREFIFSKDVATLTEYIIENYEGDTPVILSPSTEISIKDVVDLIVQIFNFKGKVIFDESKPDGQFRKPSDNSVIKNLYPEFKFTPIEEGLKETIEWFIKNYENVRK